MLGLYIHVNLATTPKARFGLEEYLAHAAEVKAVQKRNLLKTVSLRVFWVGGIPPFTRKTQLKWMVYNGKPY